MTKAAILGRLLWALRVRYDGWTRPSGVALAKRWAYAQPEVSKWLRVMGGEKVAARISMPGVHTVALICMREGVNGDWVLTSRGQPFIGSRASGTGEFEDANRAGDAAVQEVEAQAAPTKRRGTGSR